MPFDLNYNQKAERKLLITAVNAGTDEDPEWVVVGRGVEDSSIDFNADIASTTDILGITETDVNSMAPQQNLEPMTIRGGSKLAERIYDINKRKAWSEFADFQVLIIHGYVYTPSAGYTAEMHKGCTIVPTSEGGSGHVDMPVEISFSNDKELGLVDKLTDGMTFSKEEMVWIPAFRLCDVLDTDDTSPHPAFIVNDKPISGFWYGKYQASNEGGSPASKYGQTPWTNISFDNALANVSAIGKGWHMPTRAEWAAIALWSKKNGTMPLGNNNYGRDYSETTYEAIPATTGSDGRTNLVLTGTGPISWSHDGTDQGIWDMKGNVWEWQSGMRFVWGELQVLANNNAADSSRSQAAQSTEWRAIRASDGAFVEPECKTTDAAVKSSGATIKMDRISDRVTWNTGITNASSSYLPTTFNVVSCTSSISEAAKLVLRALALLPEDGDTGYGSAQIGAITSISERMITTGGAYNLGALGGIFATKGQNTRQGAEAVTGFRMAYIKI